MARSRNIVQGYIRASPVENLLLGLTKTARHYFREADLVLIRAARAGEALPAIETISSRQFEQLKNLAEFGEPITKEERTKRLQGKGGRIPKRIAGGRYRTERAQATAVYQKRARRIRKSITHFVRKDQVGQPHTFKVDDATPKELRRLSADIKLMDKKNREGWKSFTIGEKKRFAKLFDNYPREEILSTLGSPPTR